MLLDAFYPLESWNLPEHRNLKINKYDAKGAMPIQTRIKKPCNDHKSQNEPLRKWNCCKKENTIGRTKYLIQKRIKN